MSSLLNELSEKIRTLLGTLQDPVTGRSLDIECAPQVAFKDKDLYITLNVPEEQQDFYGALQEKITQHVNALLDQHQQTYKPFVILTSEKTSPLSSAPFKKVIAVASGKGGVGKSTTAIYLTYALSQLGLKVGFLDADIYGPSLPTLIGEQEKPEVDRHKLMIPIEKDGIQFMSMGFLLEKGAPVIWRGPMVSQAIQQFLTGVAWAKLDVLVLDLPPGTGDVQLTLIQKAGISGAIIVSTPQDLALVDARKALSMFEKVGIPILGIVENMSYFVCPHCQGRSDVSDHGGAQAVADHLNIPFLGAIPLELKIRELSDAGRPQELFSDSQGDRYHALAQEVVQQLDKTL